MKKALLFFSAWLCFTAAFAQNTVSTYYVTPPTSGCNGVWAVSASQFQACQAMTYNMSPPGCVQFSPGNVVGDTLYWSLCSVPCSLTVVNSNGGMCVCGTGTITSSDESAAVTPFSISPNPVTAGTDIAIRADHKLNDVSITVFNSLGQMLYSQFVPDMTNSVSLTTGGFTPGLYIVVLQSGSELLRQKLVISK